MSINLPKAAIMHKFVQCRFICSIVIRNAGIIYCLLFLEYLVDCTKIFIKIVLFCIIAKLSNLYIIFLLLKVRNLILFVMQLTTA